MTTHGRQHAVEAGVAPRRRTRAVTSAPAPSARPKVLSGSARVLLRSANRTSSATVASCDISGDGSPIGWTPTARTMPTKTSIAAYRRWLHRVSAMPRGSPNAVQADQDDAPDSM